MPVQVTYPGVYIEEIASGRRPIESASTSATAFVDVFERGPVNKPTRVDSFAEFTSVFGEFFRESKASYGVYQYFVNGGDLAWIERVAGDNATTATCSTDRVSLRAIGPGIWGNHLQAATQPSTKTAGFFDLVIRELSTPTSTLRACTRSHRSRCRWSTCSASPPWPTSTPPIGKPPT